jgi:hypothetical protein
VPSSRSRDAIAADTEGGARPEGVGRARYVFAFGNRDEDLQLVKCHPAVLGQCAALDFNDLTIARTPATRDYRLLFRTIRLKLTICEYLVV